MKYILKNINYGTYLKYKAGTKRYPIYKDEATRFTKKEVEEMRNKFKHPENWEVKEVRH